MRTLCAGEHDYFKKNFRRPSASVQQADIEVNNADGFFTNLPLSMSSKQRNYNLALLEEERTLIRQAKHQNKMARLQAQLAREQRDFTRAAQPQRGGIEPFNIEDLLHQPDPAQPVPNPPAHAPAQQIAAQVA